MKTLDIKRYLRKNKSRKNGVPGSYSIRLLWCYSRSKKPRCIERGLGTNNEDEAVARASVLLRFLYSLGYRVSNRIKLPEEDEPKLRKVIPKTERDALDGLPLFANLSPFCNVEKPDGGQ
jgi:hypothetical protein